MLYFIKNKCWTLFSLRKIALSLKMNTNPSMDEIHVGAVVETFSLATDISILSILSVQSLPKCFYNRTFTNFLQKRKQKQKVKRLPLFKNKYFLPEKTFFPDFH